MNSKHKEELNKKVNILHEKETELENLKKKLKEQEKQKTDEIQELKTQYESLFREIKSKESEIQKQKNILSEKNQFI